MKRIVAGLDGSEASRRAQAVAEDLARRLGARLTLVTVISPLPLPHSTPGRDDRGEAERLLREGGPEQGGVETDRVVLTGAPADALCELARAGDVDLIVVGRSGRGSVSRLLLGSVCDRLVRECPKPVLIVH